MAIFQEKNFEEKKEDTGRDEDEAEKCLSRERLHDKE